MSHSGGLAVRRRFGIGASLPSDGSISGLFDHMCCYIDDTPLLSGAAASECGARTPITRRAA